MYYLVFKMANTFYFEGEQKEREHSLIKNQECEFCLFAIVQYASVLEPPNQTTFNKMLILRATVATHITLRNPQYKA